MQHITIRKITDADVIELQRIGKQTFTETFESVNSEENMREYLSVGFAKEKLLIELNNQNSEFYFAEVNGKIIGYLKINMGSTQTEIKDEQALEIERIYVLKEYQGKQIGQMLYNKAIELARAMQLKYVWLGVWEENLRAIRFYEKNGFKTFDKHLFRLGSDEQTDIMMKLELKYI